MAREIVAAARFPNQVVDQVTEVHVKLWRVFAGEDGGWRRSGAGREGDLGRQRPIFVTAAHAELADRFAIDPPEQRAKERNLTYVKLDGEVGISETVPAL